jgi:hypothetical protein
VKNSRASYNTLVELFASFENFLSRLRIYTGIPPTPVLTDVLVKIMAELLYTLSLATKHVRRGRFSKFVFVDMTLGSMHRREICEERSGRERHRGSSP